VTTKVAAISYHNPAPIPAPTGGVNASVASLSYYNPAPLPSPGGAVNSKVAAISYFNPAPIPTPTGGVTASVATVSYYNPAPVPGPAGSVNTAGAALSYFNPAPIPTPTGGVSASVTSVSYYNPAPVPSSGMVWASIAAVSYENGPQPGSSTSTAAPTTTDEPAAPADAVEPAGTSAVNAVSIANGPTASTVRPRRLSRRAGGPYTILIEGANLTGATQVSFESLNPHVTVDPLVVSADGRRVMVVVWIAPDTPLGLASVVVSGAGWSTPDVPGMRVEIVP
jgi:hypothetical protein